MYTILLIIHVIVCVALIVSVLLQSSKGGGLGGAFGGGGFGGQQSRRRVNRGSNLRVKVKLSLEDVAHGVEKKIKLNKYIGCESCRSTGSEKGSTPSTCPTCHGQGQVSRITNTFLGQMQTASTCPQCGGSGEIITISVRNAMGMVLLKVKKL